MTDSIHAHRVSEVYLFGTDAPDEWVDISTTFTRKIASIAQHRSQASHLRDLADQMSRCGREHGNGHQMEYAESFKVLHPFCDA